MFTGVFSALKTLIMPAITPKITDDKEQQRIKNLAFFVNK